MFKTITYEDYRNRQKSYQTTDGVIKYIDEGKGDALLLLHGIPTSGWLYRKMIDALVSQGHRVIVPDMLGFGSSDSPGGYYVYNQQYQAERLIALMDALGIQKWTHVFHDAGGLWTWELLEKQPNRIEKLVILNTIIYKEGFKPPVRFGKNILTKAIMALYASKLFNGFLVKKLFDGGLTKNTLSKTDLQGYKQPLLEGKVNGLYYFFSKTCHDIKDYSLLFKRLKIPTVVIWGKNDVFLLWKPQAAKVVGNFDVAIRNIHLLDAKHFIQEEMPAEICAIINDSSTMRIVP